MVALITEINFLTVLVAGSPRSTPAGLVSGKNLLLGFQRAAFFVSSQGLLFHICVLLVSLPFLTRTLVLLDWVPTIIFSFYLNYLLTVPVSTYSHTEFERHNSVHKRYLRLLSALNRGQVRNCSGKNQLVLQAEMKENEENLDIKVSLEPCGFGKQTDTYQ